MPRTNLEKRIIKQSRVQQTGWIVPILNELLKSPVGIEDETDVQFLQWLAQKQVERERIRKASYDKGQTVFSPSGLATCLRRSYLGKNHKEHGLERVSLPAIEPHYYFITGDFIHLKIQFMLYKASLKWSDHIILIDIEMPVMSKHKDHGGTVDVLLLLDGEPLILDVKGLNVRGFGRIDRGEPPHEYRIQVSDYMMLFNSMITSGRWKPTDLLMEELRRWGHTSMPLVKRGFILAENKGGPDTGHPAALTEHEIKLKDNLPELRIRMEALRAHEEAKEIPEAECESTRYVEFTGCPFANFCYPEVRERERQAKRTETGDTREFKLAKPKRNSRSRRARPHK